MIDETTLTIQAFIFVDAPEGPTHFIASFLGDNALTELREFTDRISGVYGIRAHLAPVLATAPDSVQGSWVIEGTPAPNANVIQRVLQEYRNAYPEKYAAMLAEADKVRAKEAKRAFRELLDSLEARDTPRGLRKTKPAQA